MEIDLNEMPYGDIAARVEDRLRLPYGSVVSCSQGGTLPERYYLRFNTELTESQRQQLRGFLGKWIA